MRDLLGTKYLSSAVAKRQRKESLATKFLGNSQEELFSNPNVDRIMICLSQGVHFGLLSDHDPFERMCSANMELLLVFISNPGLTNLFVET
jgi:hypothetical protein